MNKNDFILILSLSIIGIILFILFNFNSSEGSVATVYYNNKLIKKINLNNNAEYDVEGYNGNIHIVVNNKKIKVEEENSPLHLCSKQGYIKNNTDVIVCLPNKIVIKIDSNELDTVIK